MSGTASVPNSFAAAVTATGAQLDANYSTIVAYINDPTNRNNFGVAPAGAGTYAVTISPAQAGGYTAGLSVMFRATTANAASPVISVSGLGNVNLVDQNKNGLPAGYIPSGGVVHAVYDGTVAVVVSVGARTSTRQVLTSGTSAAYVTPTGCKQLLVRLKGAGAGGGGSGAGGSGTGATGGVTIFNGVAAAGGFPGVVNIGVPGAGGTGGTGSASIRIAGAPGGNVGTPFLSATSALYIGGHGGGTGGGTGTNGAGANAIANSGGGGASAGVTTQPLGTLATFGTAGGGGEGEYAEILISSPLSATYTYSVGPGGAAGTSGTSGFAGGIGGSGYIVVDESY